MLLSSSFGLYLLSFLNFKTQEKWLGSGNFGVVVQGLNTIDDKKVAIKLEKKNNPYPKLVHEFENFNTFIKKSLPC